ncbi:hypothetical protein E2C01_011848 [Portunus trituberculatus]|uniref:Uncharacterized protein n=1 Tax=Portunus trituberculatus TaxID=210409 RepID=A0A5B7DCB0_PORTR|nr:hypothetical protein [Portunus trituberculatus]
MLEEYSAKYCVDASSNNSGKDAPRKNVKIGKDAVLDATDTAAHTHLHRRCSPGQLRRPTLHHVMLYTQAENTTSPAGRHTNHRHRTRRTA